MNERSRMSFLGDGLPWLRGATMTVIGAGGGGSHIVQQIAHLQVGQLTIADHDHLEDTNVQRRGHWLRRRRPPQGGTAGQAIRGPQDDNDRYTGAR